MKKRAFALFLALVLLIGVLSACGSQDPSTPATNPTAAPADNTDTASDPAPAAPSDEAINLVWMDYNGYNLDTLDAVIRELEVENIFFETIHLPNDYQPQLMIRINAGETPDVFCIEAGLPLILEFNEFCMDLSGAPVVDKILPWAIEDMTYEGKLHGIPGLFNSISLIYNKELFAQAGITEIPRTYSQLVSTAETLKAAGITPFSNGYQLGWIIFQSAAPFISAEGGTPQELADRLDSGALSFQTMSRWNDFLDYMDMTMEFGAPRALETDWELQQRALALGEAAMIHMGDWAEANIVGNNPDVQVAFIPLPISENPSESRLYSSLSFTWRVSAATAYPDAVMHALDHVLTSDNGTSYWLGMGLVPTKEISVEIPTQLGQNISAILEESDAVWAWPYTAWNSEFCDSFGEIMQAYLIGQVARDDVAVQLDNAWQQAK